MHPIPTVVTFSPVFPRVLYRNAGLAGDGLEGACAGGPDDREADAAAGRAIPAARKLRRERSISLLLHGC
jgi:hypothetical protein